MNIKKLFPDNKSSKNGFREFLNKKGFYIILFLCVAIVGVTAVTVTTRNLNNIRKGYDSGKFIPEEPAAGNDVINNGKTAGADIEVPSVDSGKNAQAKASSITTSVPSSNQKAYSKVTSKAFGKTSGDLKTNPKGTSSKPRLSKFIKPVNGEYIEKFSASVPVYSDTLEEWTVHTGVDIGGIRGTPVKCVADGVVSDIKTDPRYGYIIIIDHGQGIKTLYANLSGNDMVQINQNVRKDEVIGAIGNSAGFETAEKPHLHFEVLKDNEPVDPEKYLPVK